MKRLASPLVALHEFEPEDWFACEYPERPPDIHTLWHNAPGCAACLISADALVHQYPDDPQAGWLYESVSNGPGHGAIGPRGTPPWI